MDDRILTLGERRFALTTHAIERYAEHTGRGLTFDQARDEIASIWPLVEISDVPPAWMRANPKREGQLYARIADIAFPLAPDDVADRPLAICTTLVKLGERGVRRQRGIRPPAKPSVKETRRKFRGPRIALSRRRLLERPID